MADETVRASSSTAVMAEVREHFRPEFVNRIDEIVVFHALDAKQHPVDRAASS